MDIGHLMLKLFRPGYDSSPPRVQQTLEPLYTKSEALREEEFKRTCSDCHEQFSLEENAQFQGDRARVDIAERLLSRLTSSFEDSQKLRHGSFLDAEARQEEAFREAREERKSIFTRAQTQRASMFDREQRVREQHSAWCVSAREAIVLLGRKRRDDATVLLRKQLVEAHHTRVAHAFIAAERRRDDLVSSLASSNHTLAKTKEDAMNIIQAILPSLYRDKAKVPLQGGDSSDSLKSTPQYHLPENEPLPDGERQHTQDLARENPVVDFPDMLREAFHAAKSDGPDLSEIRRNTLRILDEIRAIENKDNSDPSDGAKPRVVESSTIDDASILLAPSKPIVSDDAGNGQDGPTKASQLMVSQHRDVDGVDGRLSIAQERRDDGASNKQDGLAKTALLMVSEHRDLDGVDGRFSIAQERRDRIFQQEQNALQARFEAAESKRDGAEALRDEAFESLLSSSLTKFEALMASHDEAFQTRENQRGAGEARWQRAFDTWSSECDDAFSSEMRHLEKQSNLANYHEDTLSQISQQVPLHQFLEDHRRVIHGAWESRHRQFCDGQARRAELLELTLPHYEPSIWTLDVEPEARGDSEDVLFPRARGRPRATPGAAKNNEEPHSLRPFIRVRKEDFMLSA
ncbi:hypothetical protein H0H93_013596 [Arthromyces matolae]|nr:hypothetical protein H0H93_013596 [Arthromyces matolae]